MSDQPQLPDRTELEQLLQALKEDETWLEGVRSNAVAWLSVIRQTRKNLESQFELYGLATNTQLPPDPAEIFARVYRTIRGLHRGILPTHIQGLAAQQSRLGHTQGGEASASSPSDSPPPSPTPQGGKGGKGNQPLAPSRSPIRITRAGGRKVGMTSWSKRLLRTAACSDTMPQRLEELAQTTWGEDWKSVEIPLAGGKKISKRSVEEDLRFGSQSAIRSALRQGIGRLFAIKSGDLQKGDVNPDLLAVYDQVDTANKWDDLQKATQSWEIEL